MNTDVFTPLAVISGIAYGLLSMLFGFWCKCLYVWIKERRGALSGTWYGSIRDASGTVIKRDQYLIKQVKNDLYGEIKRVFPENHTHRKWEFSGKIRGKDFFAIFWSKDLSVESYGCWYLHRVSDFNFEGSYLKFDDKYAQTVVPISMVLSKSQE